MARGATIVTALVTSAWLTAVLVVGAQTPDADPKALKNPVPATAASVEKGQQVFAKFCRHCHGDAGKGDGRQAPEGSRPADLTDEKWDHGSTDGAIFTTIYKGVGPKYDMDSYEGKMPDADLWNVVNYIRSIGPKPAAKPGA